MYMGEVKHHLSPKRNDVYLDLLDNVSVFLPFGLVVFFGEKAPFFHTWKIQGI